MNRPVTPAVAAEAIFHSTPNTVSCYNYLHGLLYTILIQAAKPFAWVEAFLLKGSICDRFANRYGHLASHARPLPSPHMVIYCHSIGELRTSLPLLHLARERHPDWEFTYLFKTVESYDIVGRLLPDISRTFFVPLDAPLFANRLLTRLQPDALVLMENDFRFHLIAQAKRRGLVTCFFGAELSLRDKRRRDRHRFPAALNALDIVTARDEEGRRLLLEAGAERERVVLSGNLRFDARLLPERPVPETLAHFLTAWRATGVIFTLGSTNPPEEVVLLEALGRVYSAHGNLRVVLAPRRIERTAEILKTVTAQGFKACLRSTLTGETDPAAFDLLILDTMSELRGVYRFADFAFVGGSITPSGGHNIYEAAEHGIPLLFGEHIFTNREIGNALLARDCAWIVRTADDLVEHITRLLTDDEARCAAGQRSLQAVESLGGATGTCLDLLESLVKQRSAIRGRMGVGSK